MSPDESSVELKRPSDASEDAPSQGKKPRTGEDPLVAANALASFAGPSTEEEGPAAADSSTNVPRIKRRVLACKAAAATTNRH